MDLTGQSVFSPSGLPPSPTTPAQTQYIWWNPAPPFTIPAPAFNLMNTWFDNTLSVTPTGQPTSSWNDASSSSGSSSTLNNDKTIQVAGAAFFLPARGVRCEFTVKIGAIAPVGFEIGLSSVRAQDLNAAQIIPGTVIDPVTADCMVLTPAGGNWNLVTSVGGVANSVVVAPLDLLRHVVILELSGGKVTVTFDGVVVVSTAVDIPIAALAGALFSPAAAAATFDFEYLFATQLTSV